LYGWILQRPTDCSSVTLPSAGLSAFAAITAFGLIVAGYMSAIGRWHQRNLMHHPHELERLYEIARRDDLLG
jgi:LPLT family lysophospholipid transporter-like MFS transporter